MNKIINIIKTLCKQKHIPEIRALNSQNQVIRIFSEWSHGKDFIKIAKKYCKENNYTIK